MDSVISAKSVYSVKLTQIKGPTPTSDHTLSVKVKYEPGQSPTQENPLAGFYDYSALGRFLDATPPQDRSALDLQNLLINELKRQDILEGKFKIFTKVPSEPKTAAQNEKIFRIAGSVGDVAINHGHFLEDQKLSETGNSVENLDWVIKLACPDQTTSKKFEIAFQNPEFENKVTILIKDGLTRGDALELVNTAIKKLVQETLKQLEISSNKIVFSLNRGGVLKSAVVVIGETQMMGEQPAKLSDRPRKYQDFSFK